MFTTSLQASCTCLQVLPKMASFRVLQQFTRKMSDSVTVKVAQGKLRGRKATSKYGADYFTFRGVPYAKPPVGSLRFLAPQPPEPWCGVRDAIEEGEVCPQKDLYTQKMRGHEDCLFLNVHTPKLPEGSDHPLKPVMVWIPGGTFTTGHGNSEVYGPEFIVREDVILVTVNYRVGGLGFLSLEDAGVSGNAGLKDQVLAMRWVKQNIASFGGDPDNITLCGDSAGSASVNLHMMSPMSEGLFCRAIALGGSGLHSWAYMDTATSREHAFRLGEALGLSTDNPDHLVHHLRQQSAIEISRNLNKTLSKKSNMRGEVFPFLPTLELNTNPSEEVFLPDTAINLLSTGQFKKVPYLTGMASHEGILLLRNVLNEPKLWRMLDDQFEGCIVMPLDVNVRRHTDVSLELAERIKKFYFGSEALSEKHLLNFARLESDVYFSIPIHQALKEMLKFQTCPTYLFEFSFSGSLGLFKKFLGVKGLPGACHGDVLGYLFTHAMLKHNLPAESSEMKTMNAFVKMLTNFAKSGHPTPTTDPATPTMWEPTTLSNKKYLSIGEEITMKADMEKERVKFWDDIYEEFGNKFQTVPKEQDVIPRLRASL